MSTAVAPSLAQLQAENARLRKQLTACQARGAKMAEYIRWVNKTLANTEMAAGDKIALIAVRAEWEHGAQVAGHDPDQREDEPEPLEMFMPKIAQRIGCSADSAGDRVRQLAKAGAVNRVEQNRRGPRGQPVKRILAAPTLLALTAPQQIAFSADERPNRGGKRVLLTCMECGGVKLREEVSRRIVCEDCGYVETKDTVVRMLNEDDGDEGASDDPSPIPPSPTHTPPHRQIDDAGQAPEREPDPRFADQPWYDPTKPDDALSQGLAWACLYDIPQATAWYRSEKIAYRWRHDKVILTTQERGQLGPAAFIAWLYAQYGDGDIKKLQDLALFMGVDRAAIHPPILPADDSEEMPA